MPKTIICTSGTTIAQGCPALAAAKNNTASWDTELSELSRQIEKRLACFDLSNLSPPTEVSAELNSLLLLECSGDDEVVLLAADDAVGNICAMHLAATICRGLGITKNKCTIRRVPQLQVRDAERFKKEGIPHLFEIVLEYLRDPQRRYGGGVIMNPTGGFKGVVPFMSLLGMLYGARIVYVSRASRQLVSLPPLPITHDREVFDRAREAIAWAERKGIFRSQDFLGKIPSCHPGDEDVFTGFLEITPEGDAALSPLARVLLEKDREESGQILLSPIASEKLRGMIGPPKSVALAWLLRTGSAAWREGNGHTFHGSDLEVYGEKQKPIRVAGFCSGKDFYVCQFYFEDHAGYDRELAKYQRADFTDLGSFVPLHKDKFGAEDYTESWSDLLVECEALKGEREMLIEDKKRLKESLYDLQVKLDQQRKDAKRKRQELHQRIGELERDLQNALSAESGKPDPEATSNPDSTE